MDAVLGVGGPRSPLPAGQWDLWPVVGFFAVLWIGRVIVGMPWRKPLLVAAGTGALALGPAVHAWGLTACSGVALALGLVLRRTRSTDPPAGNSPV